MDGYAFLKITTQETFFTARLAVFTKSKDEGAIGKRVTFGVDGEVDRIDHVQRTHGTTVTISDLFYQLPVRKKVLQKMQKSLFNSRSILSLQSNQDFVMTGVFSDSEFVRKLPLKY